MLVMIRNAYGALTVVLTGGTFLLVSWLTGPQVQAAFAYAVVWFLLLGGVRPAFELQAKRRRGGARRLRRGPAGPADPRPGGAVAVPLPRGVAVLADRRRPLAAGAVSADGAPRARVPAAARAPACHAPALRDGFRRF